MLTAAPLTRGQARGAPGPGGAGLEQGVGRLNEEGSDSDFPDTRETSRRRGGNTVNQKLAAEEAAVADLREDVVPSSEVIAKRLKDFIANRGQGLRNMYGETGDESKRRLGVAIESGEEMTRKLITEMGCTGEVAKDLVVLTLYDVAILIGTFWW